MAKHNPLLKYKNTESAWVVRAGVGGAADSFFLKEKSVVLEEQGLGDLSQLEPTREAFYEAYASTGQQETRTAIAGIGGKYFRFMHEMQIGDIVLYPSLKSKEIYFGEITGDYQFDKGNKKFPHQRKVTWIAKLPKGSLSKAAQYELGAARTLFKYQRNLSELIEKIKRAQSSGD
jgi:restriction system protein